ncbi:hypothetical protein DID75_05565 [Candidatus Marinamargulisbacteria bacterium SCGC AG-410-N11]|nr:hypothetical protein DID75_05565 [Candidatus Marinamargulisbacteria bacterium SCGC AG-410-N11]
MFKTSNTFLPVSAVCLSTLLGYLLAVAYVSFIDAMERMRVRGTFSKYLSPEVMNEVLKSYDDIKPEVGKKIESTILFSDIRSFTSISEHYPVEVVVTLLNEYFEAMIGEVHNYKGTMDKMIGDAIMAFWNAPIPQDDHALRAVESSFKMHELLVDLNKEWQEKEYPEVKIGIGINTGDLIIGNIGSSARVDFTAIGDNVNLGARLEGLCKNYAAGIVISEFTYEYIKDKYPCRLLDKVAVKGKELPITIYQPFRVDKENISGKWNAIHDLYMNREWDKALAEIDNFLKEFKDDKVALMFRDRVVQFKEEPPDENWQGVEVLKTK